MKLLIIIIVLPLQAVSQILVEGSRISSRPESGDEVILYSTPECSHCYYYLPLSLRISSGRGTPEASLLIMRDEITAKPTGGILHFLVEWGLRPGYENEVQAVLRSTHDSLAVIMGPVMINADSRDPSIEGNDRLAAILTGCLKNRPTTPTTPGAKMALSFRFSEAEIDQFLFYVRHPEKARSSLRINYSYSVKTRSGDERPVNATLGLSFEQILKTLKQ